MAFSFEPFLAISAGQIMAVSAGPEHCRRIRNYFIENVTVVCPNRVILKPIYWYLVLTRLAAFNVIIGSFCCSPSSDLPYTGRSAKTPVPTTSDRCWDRRLWYTIILCCPRGYSTFLVPRLVGGSRPHPSTFSAQLERKIFQCSGSWQLPPRQ